MHRELSLDCNPRYHAPLFLRIDFTCTFFGSTITVDTGWSTEAVGDINAGSYRWNGSFVHDGVTWEWGFAQRAGGLLPGMDYAWTFRPFALGECNFDMIHWPGQSWDVSAPWGIQAHGFWTHETCFGPGFEKPAAKIVVMHTKPYF